MATFLISNFVLFSLPMFVFVSICVCTQNTQTNTNTKYKKKKTYINTMHRFNGAGTWNGGARNNAPWSANDANDTTISVISSRTAVCNGGPGKSSNHCKSNRSSNSNCTNLRYLHTTSSTYRNATIS